jgi:hypothetical protein
MPNTPWLKDFLDGGALGVDWDNRLIFKKA